MSRFVALLRAINTPPRHAKMDRLRSIVETQGFRNVRTYIASGNVIFEAPEADGIIERLEEALAENLGFDVPVFLRTSNELLDVADRRPFGESEDNLAISFLPAIPHPDDVKRLEASTTGSDRLRVIGREVYWSHVGLRSESNHSEAHVVRTLGMQTTQRSARTVRKIADRFLRDPG